LKTYNNVLGEKKYFPERKLYIAPSSPLQHWLEGSFTKIVLAVDSEAELQEIYISALAAGLNTVPIIDSGNTEFSNSTFTCVGIGPDWEDKIDKITGHLKGFS
jgi:PTH2 family peptidyl-tRNA hydrolase